MSLKWLRFPPAGLDKVNPAYVSTEDVTVANTVAETTILGPGNGSLTIPGNTSVVGDRFKFSAQGLLSSSANPTLRLQLKLAGIVLADTGALGLGNLSNMHWIISGEAVVRVAGASGSLMVTGSFVTAAGDHFSFVNTVPIGIDTTTNNTTDITVIWGTASANNTITNQVALLDKFASP